MPMDAGTDSGPTDSGSDATKSEGGITDSGVDGGVPMCGTMCAYTCLNAGTCAHAKCLDEEINTGRALELNSLTLRREGSNVRLEWSPPYLDDGTGHPSQYHIWRRPLGSLTPFVLFGHNVNPTFLDMTSGSGAFDYEITAVMN